MLYYFGTFRKHTQTFWKFSKESRTFSNYLKNSKTLSKLLEGFSISTTFWDSIIFWKNICEPSGKFYSMLEFCRAFTNLLGNSIIFWNISEHFTIFLNLLSNSKAFWNILEDVGTCFIHRRKNALSKTRIFFLSLHF